MRERPNAPGFSVTELLANGTLADATAAAAAAEMAALLAFFVYFLSVFCFDSDMKMMLLCMSPGKCLN